MRTCQTTAAKCYLRTHYRKMWIYIIFTDYVAVKDHLQSNFYCLQYSARVHLSIATGKAGFRSQWKSQTNQGSTLSVKTIDQEIQVMPWKWPRCGLGWLCILLVICSTVTVISSYCVALSHGHIYPFLPAISETGVLYPEKYVFRELANLTAFLFISNAFVRFMQYKLVAEQCREEHVKLRRLNKLAFVVAILAGVGMTFVANFEIEKLCQGIIFIAQKDAFCWLVWLDAWLLFWVVFKFTAVFCMGIIFF